MYSDERRGGRQCRTEEGMTMMGVNKGNSTLFSLFFDNT